MGWGGPLTHRQFLAWTEWRAARWNDPDRTDHYLMQLTAAVIGTASKKPPDLAKLRLEFKPRRPAKDVDVLKRAVIGLVGGKVRRRIQHPDGTVEDLPD